MEAEFTTISGSYSWVDRSLTVSIAGHDVVTIDTVMNQTEADYLMVEMCDDFNEFMAESFSNWLKVKDRYNGRR